jgi:hypothetical protein
MAPFDVSAFAGQIVEGIMGDLKAMAETQVVAGKSAQPELEVVAKAGPKQDSEPALSVLSAALQDEQVRKSFGIEG